MQLYILRHGVAGRRDPRKYPRDERRPLTADGRTRMHRAARGMKALGLNFHVILTSPLTRCRQTARIVARALDHAPDPVVVEALAPGGAMKELLAAIPAVKESESVLLVGHEPDLSSLAARLLVPARVDLDVELKKGALCRIDFQGPPRPGAGRLVQLLSPRALRLMA